MLAGRRTTARLSTQLLRIRTNVTTTETSPVKPVDPPPQTPVTPPPPSLSSKPQPAPAAVDAQESTETTKKRTRGRVWPTRRPEISLERPRQYSRPIGIGVLPAYDEALEYIKRDSRRVKEELKQYQVTLDKAQNEPVVDTAEVERLAEKVKILEIQSEINLPSVRWKARNGMGEFVTC